MYTKNAFKNLRNRYKAVLKKCTLLNTFGSLALVASLLCGVTPAFANTPDVTVTTQVYDEANISNYYTTYEVPSYDATNGTYITTKYGVIIGLGGQGNYTDIGDLIVDAITKTTSDVTSSESSKTYFTSITQVSSSDTCTFSIDYEGNTYYFAVNGTNSLISDTDNRIYNQSNSGDVNTNFIGLNEPFIKGGAISNLSGGAINSQSFSIGNITGHFIGNSISNTGNAHGGAISNFSYSSNYGVYASSSIGNITGSFIGNNVSSSHTQHAAYGGAISNYSFSNYGVHTSSSIDSITGSFIGNYATSTQGSAYGGAISNYSSSISSSTASSSIGNITGSFIGNSISHTGNAHGGAISNYSSSSDTNTTASSSIGNITASFIGNNVSSSDTNYAAFGGAISNYSSAISSATASSSIGNITGSFIENSISHTGNAHGGAISNYSSSISSATASSSIGNITGSFIGNYANSSSDTAQGGAIYNAGSTTKIGNITSSFIGNSSSGATSAHGGAIYNYSGTIGDISGSFIGNYAYGATLAQGGAIYNTGTINSISGSFIGNYASGTYTYGGAIYNENNLTFLASNETHIFTDNYTITDGGTTKDYNFITSYGGSLTFDIKGTGGFILNDSIIGSNELAYQIVISGENKENNIFYLRAFSKIVS